MFYDCGTPRIFEEKPRKYVFRVSPHATMDNVGAAHYVKAKTPDLKVYSGINQNYAWGQDSWRDFVGAMKVLVTGGTGNVGRKAVTRLVQSGHDVTVIGRRPNMTVPGGRYAACDITDFASIREQMTGME